MKFKNNGKPFDPDAPGAMAQKVISFLDKRPPDDFLYVEQLAGLLKVNTHWIRSMFGKKLEEMGYSFMFKNRRVYGSRPAMAAMRKAIGK